MSDVKQILNTALENRVKELHDLLGDTIRRLTTTEQKIERLEKQTGLDALNPAE